MPLNEVEYKWECPFCGRQMKGLDIFPNEACCGEVGHAQKLAYCKRCEEFMPTIDDGETCAHCKLVL